MRYYLEFRTSTPYSGTFSTGEPVPKPSRNRNNKYVPFDMFDIKNKRLIRFPINLKNRLFLGPRFSLLQVLEYSSRS